MISYYDLHQLFIGGCLFINIPCNSFKDKFLTKKLMKAIDADKVSFNNDKLFYHKYNAIEEPVQYKLRILVNNKSNDKIRAVNEASYECKSSDDNEYPDGLFD